MTTSTPPTPPLPPTAEQTTSPGGFGQFFGRAVTVTALASVAALATLTVAVFVVVAGVVGLVAAAGMPLPLTHVAGDERASDKVAVISIDGPIVGGASVPGWFGAPLTGADDVIEQLERAADDDDTVAVVLEVSTPGGTIPGSMDIAAAVGGFRDTGKPVVAYVSDISASGGVWATATADRVVGHPGSLTGSVGVLYGPFTVYDGVTSLDGGLLDGGVTAEAIDSFFLTAGDRKDAGDPFRGLDESERERIQRIVDVAYDDFVAVVADNRRVTANQLVDELGADLLAAGDAEAAGFYDQVGRFDDAWQLAAELAGADRVSVVALQRPAGLLASLAEHTAPGREGAYSELCTLTTARATVFHGDLTGYCETVR